MDNATLATLTDFPARLEAHFAAIPAEYRNWTPPSWEGVPSEPFTAIEQICHLRDIEVDGYHLRFLRTLSEVEPELPAVDSEALAVLRNYAAAAPSDVFDAFRQARAKTMTLIGAFTQKQWDRRAIFDGYGTVTLRSLVHYLCSHDQQHLAGLQWLLGQIESVRA